MKPRQEEEAAEQCLVYAQQLHAKLGIITDYGKFIWIHTLDREPKEIHYIWDEDRVLSKDYRVTGAVESILSALDPSTDSIVHPKAIDPSGLADSVWQTIWLATHEEPKPCLATFVELFLYKFLSDLDLLPVGLKIDALNCSEADFVRQYGKTQIEYYVQAVRPQMKGLFPASTPSRIPLGGYLPGSDITSIIDGFVFLEPGMTNHNHPLQTFNHSFLAAIAAFVNFGKIRNIDVEFKSRVYEKFLKKNVKQQKLGQYLTPRNVVRAILGMANLSQLIQRGQASICDPACGVGGFILEPLLHEDMLKGNMVLENGMATWKNELLGLEVDRQTNILAKANMLIHMAEEYVSLPSAGRQSFVELMNQTFLLVDHDKMLGSLEFPQRNHFDLILTNPPYVVKGSKTIKEKIFQNEVLKETYDRAGTGVESLFIRWVVDALKPGGRAFVIIPTGLLTRSEIAVRSYVRKHCIIDGIIALPERTFFNTPNRTYVIALTKKNQSTDDQTMPVFAYLVREVGETRDSLRFPCRSDLPDLVRQFRAFYADKIVFEPRNMSCKLIPASEFAPEDRWDADRFWTSEERAELGLTETTTVNINEFESELTLMVDSVKAELEPLKLENGGGDRGIEVPLSDAHFFSLIRGRRVTRKNIHENPGGIPVISGHGEPESYLGHVSEDWLSKNGIPVYTEPMITVNANGSVGDVFLRKEAKYTIHDDVIGIKVVNDRILPSYAVHAIREAVARAQFRYDAKLYVKRLRPLTIRIPVNQHNEPDQERQALLADRYERLEELKRMVQTFSRELDQKFITTS